jgi:hypothetical protein
VSLEASSRRAGSGPPPSSEAEAAPLGKRLREDSSDDICGNKRQKVEPETSGDEKESPETRCALYAAQLLRSKWNRTHVITILLEGTCFLSR